MGKRLYRRRWEARHVYITKKVVGGREGAANMKRRSETGGWQGQSIPGPSFSSSSGMEGREGMRSICPTIHGDAHTMFQRREAGM